MGISALRLCLTKMRSERIKTLIFDIDEDF